MGLGKYGHKYHRGVKTIASLFIIAIRTKSHGPPSLGNREPFGFEGHGPERKRKATGARILPREPNTP